jgi:hypothetical protein
MRRAVLFACALVACAPRALPAQPEDPGCGRVELSAVPPPRRRVDLVLSVNGEECHRELLAARWQGRITRMCGPEWFAPGENRVELAIDPPGCAPPIARRAVACWLPEPD